jgi:hypothetical protein
MSRRYLSFKTCSCQNEAQKKQNTEFRNHYPLYSNEPSAVTTADAMLFIFFYGALTNNILGRESIDKSRAESGQPIATRILASIHQPL